MDKQDATLRNSCTVQSVQEWATKRGVQYDFAVSAEAFGVSGDAHELADYGWTTTGLTLADGDGADFAKLLLSVPAAEVDMGTPCMVQLHDNNDLLQSPAIFGDAISVWWAMVKMGSTNLPRKFVMEMWGAFPNASANDTTTGLGLVEGGGSPATANDHLAFIYSDAVNFRIRSGAANGSVAGPAVDNNPHLFRIEIDRIAAIVNFFVDNVQYGTLALEADEFPCSFGASSKVTNQVDLYGGRLYWDG